MLPLAPAAHAQVPTSLLVNVLLARLTLRLAYTAEWISTGSFS